MKRIFFLIIVITCFSSQRVLCQKTNTPQKTITHLQTPIMGWASWNNFRININEEIIKAQADAMISSGMKEAGYTYINIDDGYLGGRDKNGMLLNHPKRFPNGIKALAELIHSKDLKIGLYTDAGINTCASYWDKDTIGVGVGLFGHEYKDLSLMLSNWDCDFIKVDWCGGQWLGLNEEVRYTQIGKIIREIKPSAIFNICSWKFPGQWVINVADSWRISGDIASSFESVMAIIDINSELWRYSGPGHVNDMDMLQVGRGMSFEEDKTHFTMWCMMNSPLIAGNDLTTMSEQTRQILTNKSLIEINQDLLVYQARKLVDYGELEVWAKPLKSTISGEVAVVLLNRSDKEKKITFQLNDIGINSSKGYYVYDLWSNEKSQKSNVDSLEYNIASHGVVALKVIGIMEPFNVFQFENP